MDHVTLEESNVMAAAAAAVCVDGFHCNSEVMGRVSWQDLCDVPESLQPNSGGNIIKESSYCLKLCDLYS